MQKKYLFLVFLVATSFAYHELSKSKTQKKPLESTKKLEIIEFKLPEYDFSHTFEKNPLKQKTSAKELKLRINLL